MAEEVVFTAEGAASINEADASPKPAFEDMRQRLNALGMTDEQVRETVMAYCKERSADPLAKADAYKLAFHCVVAQWMARLVRFGGYAYPELPEVFVEFGESLARNTADVKPDLRETAISSLSSLYYSLRVRGVSDEELLAATNQIAQNAIETDIYAQEGMKGVSGVGAVQALADNLANLRRFGIWYHSKLCSAFAQWWRHRRDNRLRVLEPAPKARCPDNRAPAGARRFSHTRRIRRHVRPLSC